MMYQEAAAPGSRPLPVRLSLLGRQWEAVDSGLRVGQADPWGPWLCPFSLEKSLPTSPLSRLQNTNNGPIFKLREGAAYSHFLLRCASLVLRRVLSEYVSNDWVGE